MNSFLLQISSSSIAALVVYASPVKTDETKAQAPNIKINKFEIIVLVATPVPYAIVPILDARPNYFLKFKAISFFFIKTIPIL